MLLKFKFCNHIDAHIKPAIRYFTVITSSNFIYMCILLSDALLSVCTKLYIPNFWKISVVYCTLFVPLCVCVCVCVCACVRVRAYMYTYVYV